MTTSGIEVIHRPDNTTAFAISYTAECYREALADLVGSIEDPADWQASSAESVAYFRDKLDSLGAIAGIDY